MIITLLNMHVATSSECVHVLAAVV